MTQHPSHEELFDAACEGDAGPLASHLESCAECRAAFARLRSGARLLDEARDVPEVDNLDWGRIDAAVNAEAERVAAGIRSGAIRAPRPWAAYAAGAVALAAAAVGVVYLKDRPVESPDPVAETHRPAERPSAPAPAARFEGAVLLAAGGATQTPAGATEPVRIAAGAALREGARVETAAAGRAVFTVQPSVALDVRPGSDVTLATLREGDASVLLARGEVAVDRDGDAGRATVRAGRWTVGVDGDAVVRVESSLVRVVVLSGRAEVGEPTSRTSYTGPIVLELPDTGDKRAVPGAMEDPYHLDVGLLAPGGTMWPVPAIDPAAVVSVRNGGRLPSSLEALRVARPMTLEARIGRLLMTLEVGSGEVRGWQRAPVVASAQPNANRAPAPAPTAQPMAGRDLTATEHRVMQRTLGGRFGHCFDICREQNRCARDSHGHVNLDVRADGSFSVASVDPGAEGARSCLVDEAQRIRFPATGGEFSYRIPIR